MAPVSSAGPTSPPPRGKTQYVYDWLKERILSGEIEPGAPLRQSEVARTLGVSYTPVREALRQLQATGLLQHTADRGSAVTALGEQAVVELYALRGAIEGLAARLAATRCTPADLSSLTASVSAAEADLAAGVPGAVLAAHSRDFHAAVARIGGPEVIAPRLEQLWSAYPIPRSATVWRDRGLAGELLAEHRELVQRLADRDEAGAADLMVAHIQRAADLRRPGAADADETADPG